MPPAAPHPNWAVIHPTPFLLARLSELCALGKLLSLSVPLSLFSQQLYGTNNSSYLTGLVLRVKCRYLLTTVSGTDWLHDTSLRLLLFFCVCLPQECGAQQDQGFVCPVNT